MLLQEPRGPAWVRRTRRVLRELENSPELQSPRGAAWESHHQQRRGGNRSPSALYPPRVCS
ncbi:hypothetical protein HispidOSU_014423 [Sigmodon hispidus]